MDRALFKQQIEHAAATVSGSTLDVSGLVLQVIRILMQDAHMRLNLSTLNACYR